MAREREREEERIIEWKCEVIDWNKRIRECAMLPQENEEIIQTKMIIKVRRIQCTTKYHPYKAV